MLRLLCSVMALATVSRVFTSGQDTDPTVVKLEDVPVAVLQELLTLTDEGLVDGELERESRQIYRLRCRDVAYYEFKFKDQYIILANPGRGHMDKILVRQGELPTPTQSVEERASESGVVCLRYILVGPKGPLACEGSDGKLVAGSDEWRNELAESGRLSRLKNENGSVDWNRAYQWSRRQFRRSWNRSEEAARRSSDVFRFVQARGATIRPRSYVEDPLKPGETIKIVKTEHFTKLRMFVVPGRRWTSRRFRRPYYMNYERSLRNHLCEVLDGITCNTTNTEVTADVEEQSLNGLIYVAITLTGNHSYLQTLFRRHGIGITFRAYYTQGGPILTLRYGLDLFSPRDKRDAESTPTYWSIPNERLLFPDYNQFRTATCGAVGSGPVAWAMVLGYLDRFGHYRPESNYSTEIFPHRVAPRRFTSRDTNLTSWITKIKEQLGTICFFGQGLTFVRRMSKIEEFYKQIQRDGELKEDRDTKSNAGIYGNSYRDTAIEYIKDGSPAIIGVHTSSRFFSLHYAVATRTRRRVRLSRKCYYWGLCTPWRSEDTWDFYLHMGWGGKWNGWWEARAFYAATLSK